MNNINIIKELEEVTRFVCDKICRYIDYHDDSLSETDLDRLEEKYCIECPVAKMRGDDNND